MNSLRSAFVTVVSLLAAVPAAAQVAGEPCTASEAEVCQDTSTVLTCDASALVWTEIPCAEITPSSTCGDFPCVGSACPVDFVTCLATSGNVCKGVGVLFDQDTTNNNRVMSTPCVAGRACTVTSSGETCQALPAGASACTVSSPVTSCAGDNLVVCIGFEGGDAVISSPGVVDCTAFGFVCGDAGEGPTCLENIDQRCPAGGDGSACDGPVAVECSGGEVFNSTDCASSGRACVENGVGATCIIPDSECGAAGLGVCAGTVATICEAGRFVTETDCAGLSRRCGAVPGENGQIGCVTTGGEGEGEGEGEAECSADADCEDDEACDEGECRRIRTSRGGDEEEEEEPSFFNCASTGTATPAGLALLALVLRRRRR